MGVAVRLFLGVVVLTAVSLWFGRHYAWATFPQARSLVIAYVDNPPPHFGPVTRMQRGKPSGTRIYLFHGLRSDRSYWGDEPYRQFVEARLAKGDELLIPALPYAEAGLFRDGGASYCRAFIQWMRDLDARLPKAERTYTAGTSYGALHAAIAAAEMPDVEAYVAIVPVVDISRLPEFWMVSNDRCTQAVYADHMKPGLVIYGDSDERAGSDLIARSVVEAHAESKVYPGLGHETTDEALDYASRWLDALR